MHSSVAPPLPPPPPVKTVMYSSPRSHEGVYSDLMRTTNDSPIFASTSSTATSSNQYAPPSPRTAYRNSYMPPINLNEGQLPALPFPANNMHGSTQQRRPQSNPLLPERRGADNEETGEAVKLILYHVNNFRRNSAYCLPSSLRLTLVQRTVHHESVVDTIIHPELRDRMILLQDRFDLAECLLDYANSVTIHGDDVLSHNNWEIDEKWLRRYGFLIDQSTLNIANRWRRERGESELRLDELVPADGTPGSN